MDQVEFDAIKTRVKVGAPQPSDLLALVTETERLRGLLVCREGTDDGATCRDLDARAADGSQAPCEACSASHRGDCSWHHNWDLCNCDGGRASVQPT